MTSLRVTEIFDSIQGESTHAGRPCTFVRLTGCPLRCRWCDTTYAYEGGREMELSAIIDAVIASGQRLVEITGGEPLAQAGTVELARRLCDRGFEVLLETSGALDISPLDPRVRRIIDVKCPSSGMADRNRWDNLSLLRPHDEVKFVLADRGDYEFARETIRSRCLGGRCALLFSPVTGRLPPAILAEWILADHLPVRLQIQLHRILWPDEPRRR